MRPAPLRHLRPTGRPHPLGGGVVGTYVHTYDVPRRQSYQVRSPSMRPAQDSSGGPSATPIYDALYAEYGQVLPDPAGRPHGEEDLGFTAFGSHPARLGVRRLVQLVGLVQRLQRGGTAPSSRGGGPRRAAGHARAHHARRRPSGSRARAEPTGTGMHHIPAALPPGAARAGSVNGAGT